MHSNQYLEGRKRRKLTDADELEIVRDYEETSILVLAQTYGIARSTVCRILSDHGVTMRPRGRPKHD